MSDADARRWFELAFESSPNVMLMVSATGTVLLANPAVRTVFGRDERDLQGLDVGVLVAPASRPKLRKLRARYEEEGRRRPFRSDVELTGIHADGHPFPIAVGLGLVRTEHSALVLVSIVDITRRKRSEDRIRTMNQALREEVDRRTRALSDRNLELEREVRSRQEAESALRETQRRLQEANARLERLANEDALTGIANRREFDNRLQLEFARAARRREPLTLILLDLDRFKEFNDAAGHLAGDACLRRVADVLKLCLGRATDLLARYGGEEFVALLPDTPIEAGARLATRMRKAVGGLGIPHPGPAGGSVTVSAGVASIVPTARSHPHALLDAADRALYTAKDRGRDRVCVATSTRAGDIAGASDEPAGASDDTAAD